MYSAADAGQPSGFRLRFDVFFGTQTAFLRGGFDGFLDAVESIGTILTRHVRDAPHRRGAGFSAHYRLFSHDDAGSASERGW
jgi:hypothetical protein